MVSEVEAFLMSLLWHVWESFGKPSAHLSRPSNDFTVLNLCLLKMFLSPAMNPG